MDKSRGCENNSPYEDNDDESCCRTDIKADNINPALNMVHLKLWAKHK